MQLENFIFYMRGLCICFTNLFSEFMWCRSALETEQNIEQKTIVCSRNAQYNLYRKLFILIKWYQIIDKELFEEIS